MPIYKAETEKIARRDAAQADLARWQSRVNELKGSISRRIVFVADRYNRNIHLPELGSVAIKSVLDGYNAGISLNIGRLRGVMRGIE